MTRVSPFSCGSDSIVVEKTIVTKEVSWGLPSRPLTQPRETNEVASLVKKQKRRRIEDEMEWIEFTEGHFENQKGAEETQLGHFWTRVSKLLECLRVV